MRISAIVGAIGSFALFVVIVSLGGYDYLTIQSAIMAGFMFLGFVICLSRIEK